ncbi:MAG: hypothetical protein R2807_03030 [Chitinophagales bacterium]
MNHIKTQAMLTPLKYMAHVLIFFTITIVQAQSVSENSILCYVSADYAVHAVNKSLSTQQPYTATCMPLVSVHDNYFITNKPAVLNVNVHVVDDTHEQYIKQTIQLKGKNNIYEMPILAYVSNDLLLSNTAKIHSIEFTNMSDATVDLKELNFSNTSAKYEVKLNQLFTIDSKNLGSKNYMFSSATSKHVNINVYNTNGGFARKIMKTLQAGENEIEFDELQLNEGKYVVTITEQS